MKLSEIIHWRGNRQRLVLLEEIEAVREQVKGYYRDSKTSAQGMATVNQFLDDTRLYLEIGRDRFRMPANWVEAAIQPSVEDLLLFSEPLAKV